MKKICVTGANGFIGKSICRSLIKWGIFVRGTVRSQNLTSKTSNYECVSVGDISNNTNWSEAIFGCECIIHSAGIAHKINELDGENSQIYQKVNVDATKKLANQAVAAGVKRLIFLSSIKVNGESTEKFFQTQVLKNEYKKVFSHDDILAPEDNYAASKLEAEKVLWDISAKTGLEIVILRLPLVYGPGVKGNLAKLLNIIRLGIPLPLGGIKNKRSLIGIDNLIDLIYRCIEHPDANGKTFLVSDGEDVSTPDLLRHISSSMEKPSYLFSVPVFLLKFISYIFGKQNEMNRLTSSLQVDSRFTREILDWKPRVSLRDGIKNMVKDR